MANTISVGVSVNLQGAFPFSLPQPSIAAITLSGTGMAAGFQAVGTAAENLDIGDVDLTNGGHLVMRNLDATNYVQFGKDSTGFVAVTRLPVSGFYQYVFIDPGVTPQLKANTASCKVEFYLWQA